MRAAGPSGAHAIAEGARRLEKLTIRRKVGKNLRVNVAASWGRNVFTAYLDRTSTMNGMFLSLGIVKSLSGVCIWPYYYFSYG